MMNAPIPTEIRLRKGASILAVSYGENDVFSLTTEYLRVHSPSAEVKGHGPGQEVLQVGKENVTIRAIEPVGHYAVRLRESSRFPCRPAALPARVHDP